MTKNPIATKRLSEDYAFDSELNEQKLVRRIVRPGMTVFDVGANVGKYTKLLSLLVGEGGIVFSFEPCKPTCDKLKSEVEEYDLTNVKILNNAVFSKNCYVQLNEFPERFATWNSLGHPIMDNPDRPGEIVTTVSTREVEAVTLDSFCEQAGIDEIDYLKVDVEGAEIFVLVGASRLLRRKAIKYLQFEISSKMLEGLGTRASDAFAFLIENGYECHWICDDGAIGDIATDSTSFYENYIAYPATWNSGNKGDERSFGRTDHDHEEAGSLVRVNSAGEIAAPASWQALRKLKNVKLYAGNLPTLNANKYDGWVGLSLTVNDSRHILHDVTHPFPLPDNSVDAFQAEDVFEHISYDKLLPVVNEIFRVLKPGGYFRLSVPDYGCDVLIDRTVKDQLGNLLFDPAGGGTIQNPEHIWFPRIANVKELLDRSDFRKLGSIEYFQYWNSDGSFIDRAIDYSKGFVQRTPDHDKRVQYPRRPMSLVVDLTKSRPGPSETKCHLMETNVNEMVATSNPGSVRISFVIIVLNGMPFIERCIDAIYEIAHEIIIVEGAVANCMFAANPDGSSKDGTVEYIRNYADRDKKVKLIQGRWDEKCEMQNAALELVTGNYIWLVDSDEVYKRDDLYSIKEILEHDSSITQVNFIPDNFWKGFDYIFFSPKFLDPSAHYRRVFKYIKGARFTNHRPPTMVHPGSDKTTEEMKLLDGYATRAMGLKIYHYSYVLDSQVRQKIELYRRYGWEKMWNLNLTEWYDECFLKWTPENREELEACLPVWTGDRNSYTLKFEGAHPEVIAAHMDSLRTFLGAKTNISNGNLPSVSIGREEMKRLRPETLIGPEYIQVLCSMASQAVKYPGDMIEVGVHKGGSLFRLAEHLVANHKSDFVNRRLLGVDTFVGHPSADPNLDPPHHYKGRFSDTSYEKVWDTFKVFNFVDIYQGDCKGVFQNFPTHQQFCLAHIDVDISKSAIDSIEYIYPRLSKGGVMIFDEYEGYGQQAFIDEYFRDKPVKVAKRTGLQGKNYGLIVAKLTRDQIEQSKSASPWNSRNYVMGNVIDAITEILSEFHSKPIINALETGTIRSYAEKHESTLHISRALGKRGKLVSVDINPQSIAISKDICDNAPNVEWVLSDSLSYLSSLKDARFHFVLLDSVNDREVIFKEFTLVAPMIKENGVLMVDDAGINLSGEGYDNTAAEKGRKVWEFLLDSGVNFQVLETPQDHGTQLKVLFNRDNISRIEAGFDKLKQAGSSKSARSKRKSGSGKPIKRVKVAGIDETEKDLTQIQDGSDFEITLKKLIADSKPSSVIEAGTYLASGTTRVIAEALRDNGLGSTRFYSIECNTENYLKATHNVKKAELDSYVTLVNGLSVPRCMLPTQLEIERSTVTDVEYDDIYVDHPEAERPSLYFQETNFPDVPDNMLGRLLRSFDYKPDLVLLDSGGHMGYVEFSYLISKLRGPCYIALDDVYHIKHHKSLLFMQNDPRFEIINLSHEKFGFCIAKFTPAAGETRDRTENILWVRTDSIGDAVLASSMLPYIKKKYHNGKITAVCQRHIAELYEASPFVDEVIPLDKNGFASDNEYASWFLEQISGLDVDVAINSVFSRDAVSDRITLAAQADEYVALYGDSVNISAHDWEDANRYYTSLIPHCAGHRTEIQRHSDFLDALGIEHEELQPIIWTAEEDKAFADDFFRENGIRPEKTIVLFAGAQSELRRYEKYGEALSQICDEGDYTVIALGSSPDGEINSLNLKDIKTATYDLSGKTTIRQSAEIIRRSCLAVGAETGLAHIACAVGTRNVILLGGGQFGRFMPYSSPTSIVSLPLECYGCNWSCRFIRSHCVQDVNTGVFATAIREALRNTSEKPRVYVQGLEDWKPKPSEPERIRLDNFLDLESVDLIEVRFEASIKKNVGDNSDGQMNISDDGEIDPTSYEDVLNEMNRLEQSGKSDMGLRVLNLFIEKHGASTKLLNLLAEYKIKNNDKEAAREILNKILASEPGSVDALNNLSVVDILEEKWISAARNLELVLSIDVDNETAIANLGYLKAILTAQKEALEVERAAVTERNVMAFQNTMDGANDAYPLTEQLSYSPGLPQGAKKRTDLQSVFSPEEFPRGSRNSSEMSGADEDSRLDEIVNRIVSLPHDWHLAGSVGPNVIRAMANCLKGRRVYHSVETGSGKTTLLFSHASQDHKVFSVDAGKSITNVRNSFLFDPRRVEFIEGPTQKTLPLYKFQHKLQIAFIDGPHAYPFPQLEYYYIYPHLEKDSLLIIDDINIPTIKQLFDFLREDEMFSLLEVVDNTAFLERTEAQTFSQFGDGWETQNYNKRHLSQ